MLASAFFFGMHADVLLSALLSAVVAVAGTVLTLRHSRQVLEYARRTRRTTETAEELREAGQHLRAVATRISEYAQRPCGTAEFAPLRRSRYRIEVLAAENTPVVTELRAVVECLDRWIATELPAVDPDTVYDAETHRVCLGTAMAQEHARGEAGRAVTAAQTRIRALSRTD